jgi:hypothetical protein
LSKKSLDSGLSFEGWIRNPSQGIPTLHTPAVPLTASPTHRAPRQALTDSFCNLAGTTCVDTATGFGTVGVSDNYGSGGNLTYAWNTCVDEHHWSGTAATDPCSS